jgi:hypothetical protein
VIRSPEWVKAQSKEKIVLTLFQQIGIEGALKEVAKEEGLKDARVVKTRWVDGLPMIKLCWDWWAVRHPIIKGIRHRVGYAYHYISVQIWGDPDITPQLAILGRYRPEGNCFESGDVLPINLGQDPVIDLDQMKEAIRDAIKIPEWESTPDVSVSRPKSKVRII